MQDTTEASYTSLSIRLQSAIWKMIKSQVKGQTTDSTHVELVKFLEQVAHPLTFGLKPIKSYSYPFMRFMGPYFIYNEFVSVWQRDS